MTESVICVSDDNHHDHHAVLTFVKRTMEHLQQVRHLQVSHVVQWSDGCGAQYKSKGPFADVAASELTLDCSSTAATSDRGMARVLAMGRLQ